MRQENTVQHSNDAASLRYLRQGSGLPLVFVHGYFGGAAVWENQLEILSEQFDVIAPEHAGYGESHKTSGCDRIADFGAQILALLDSLNIQNFYLVGHSMGGMIAQQITADAPDRVKRLVCYGTGPRGSMPDRFETIAQSRQRIVDNGAANTGRQIAAKWFRQGERDQAYPLAADIAEKMSEASALAGLTAMENWDGCEQLQKIHQPTLVLWGDRDKSYQWPEPETLWQNIANCDLAVMPGCSHNAHLEKPDLFNLLIKDFLGASS